MRLRDVARVVFSARVVSTVAIAGALSIVAASCGGSGSSHGNGEPDGSTGLNLGNEGGTKTGARVPSAGRTPCSRQKGHHG